MNPPHGANWSHQETKAECRLRGVLHPMKSTLCALLLGLGALQAATLDLGTRRELFVDDHLISRLGGAAQTRLHQPQPQDIAITHDAPWEGSGSGYHSIFKDGELYRMYYKSWQLTVNPKGGVNTGEHPLFTCYAQSRDGIHWEKPKLGLVEFQGSRDNNIVLAPGLIGKANPDPGHIAVFKDENPAAPAHARYKAIIRSAKPHGLLAFGSADGLKWAPLQETPVITEGAFDSQNLAFWDPKAKLYRAYWRYFTGGVTKEGEWKPQGDRGIRTATSPDFLKWDKPRDLRYGNAPPEQLYTNQIKPYFRAPHLLLGFPTRYLERGWSPSMKALPELELRQARSKASDRYGMAITEGLFMASRDGLHFKRWSEAFLPPGIEREGTWNYGHQYAAWSLVPTASALPGAPQELSFYTTESYWSGRSSALRRHSLRMDGFVSVYAPMKGGELVTRKLRFGGNRLELNFASSAAGSIHVELQDEEGKPIAGHALADCDVLFGDSLQRTVTWKGEADLSALIGKTLRLRFVLQDAHLYALQFTNPKTQP
jgi:hypothetical protein